MSSVCVVPSEARGSHWITATGVPDSFEPPYGYWKVNSGPLQEQGVPLSTEPSLNCFLCKLFFWYCFFDCRTPSRNLDYDKENNQEEENLMNSETFVNEVYDEQVCQGVWEDFKGRGW